MASIIYDMIAPVDSIQGGQARPGTVRSAPVADLLPPSERPSPHATRSQVTTNFLYAIQIFGRLYSRTYAFSSAFCTVSD